METFRAARWRPDHRQTSRNAINHDIKKAPDRGTQPEDRYLNERVINIHYDYDAPNGYKNKQLKSRIPQQQP